MSNYFFNVEFSEKVFLGAKKAKRRYTGLALGWRLKVFNGYRCILPADKNINFSALGKMVYG